MVRKRKVDTEGEARKDAVTDNKTETETEVDAVKQFIESLREMQSSTDRADKEFDTYLRHRSSVHNFLSKQLEGFLKGAENLKEEKLALEDAVYNRTISNIDYKFSLLSSKIDKYIEDGEIGQDIERLKDEMGDSVRSIIDRVSSELKTKHEQLFAEMQREHAKVTDRWRVILQGDSDIKQIKMDQSALKLDYMERLDAILDTVNGLAERLNKMQSKK